MSTSSCFRGFLGIFILKAIADEPKSGYALMKHMAEHVGQKPSAGSMYPLLDTMHERGLISVKNVGRSKEYSITKIGKKHLTHIEEKRDECLENIIESMKMLSTITGDNMAFPLAMIGSLKAGKIPFKEINPEWDTFKETLFSMMQAGTLRKNAPRVKKIIARAQNELRDL